MNTTFLSEVGWELAYLTALALTMAALAHLLVQFYKTARRQVSKLRELEQFKSSYRTQIIELYRWFAGDDCALMLLDYLDRELVGGELRPTGSYRLDVAIHGLQAVRQAVRDHHFNERCRRSAEAVCARSDSAPCDPRITQEQMAEIRNACPEGIDVDVFMTLCVNQLLEGRTVKVISERREYLNSRPEKAPFDRLSEPTLSCIVNDRGEQLWPAPLAAGSLESRLHQVEAIYEVVKPTVDEKVDEVLRLMRLFENAWDKSPRSIGREEQQAVRAAQRALRQTMRQAPVSQVERETIRAVFLRNGFTIKEGQTDLKPYVYAAAEELLSIARASWRRTQAAGVPDALREAVEYLDDNPFNEIGAGSILHRAMRDALYATPQPGPDVRSLVSADDVRDACANAVSVFAEEANADQCREVAEYMREVLLALIARRTAHKQQEE